MAQDHGGNLLKAAKKYGLKQEEIIDFSANINFLGPPAEVKRVIKDNLEGIVNYPDPNSSRLRDLLAEKLSLKPKNLIVSNGAVELIYLLAKVLQPARALVLAPTFSEYQAAVRSCGGQIKEFVLTKERDFALDIDALLAKLEAVELFFLCNPNNPTGQLLSRKEIVRLLEFAKSEDVFVVIDEAFVHFVEEDITVADLVTQYDNLFVLHSLTKFFAIPGLRLGYGITNPKLVKELKANKDPWSVNYLAQLAGETALNAGEYIKESKAKIKQEKEFLYHKLKDIPGLKVYYPRANYIFIELVKSGLTASLIEAELGKKGILIRNCNTYSGLGEDFIRVAVKSREDNLLLVDSLRWIRFL